LKELYCGYNQLIFLDNLPNTLQILECYGNKLRNLDNLPNTLQVLYCSYNLITSLDNLPQSLQILYCSNNQINSFNQTLLNCRNLNVFYYYNNPIEFTPQQLNFIQWIEQRNITRRNNRNYYNDGQNVHNSSLQRSLMKSIQNLLK
jgi:Leucine-rich repeat (LRR) protein